MCSIYMNWLWVEAEHIYVRTCRDSKFTQFYKRIARRKGNKVALVAGARKLHTIIYWMLINLERYHIQMYHLGRISA